MTITQYIEDRGLSARQFCLSAGISPQYLSVVQHGRQTPSMTMALKVHLATDGLVNMLDNLALEHKNQALDTGSITSVEVDRVTASTG